MVDRPVLHFFFDTTDKMHLGAVHPLESFIKQLLGIVGQQGVISAQINAAIMRFYCPRLRTRGQEAEYQRSLVKQGYRHGFADELPLLYPSRPSSREITQEILLPLLLDVTNSVFAIDGLDECDNRRGERDELVGILEEMVKLGARVYVSSRYGAIPYGFAAGALHVRVQKAHIHVRQDVAKVIAAEISNKMRIKVITESKDTLANIRAVLLNKADAYVSSYSWTPQWA